MYRLIVNRCSIAVFSTLDEATKEARFLQEKGYPAKIPIVHCETKTCVDNYFPLCKKG